MTRLEDRYRRLLRLLPAWYRAHREQEMVDVFLTDREARERDTGELDAEYGWPGWGEAASVAGLAVRTRVGGPGDPPGPRAVGDVVRTAALAAVLLCAAGAAASLVWAIVAATVDPGASRTYLLGVVRPLSSGDRYDVVVLVLGLFWLPAWTALANGRARLASVLALAPVVPLAVSLVDLLGRGSVAAAAIILGTALPQVAAVVLLWLGFHRDAPPPAVERQWALLAGAVLAVLASASLALLVPGAFRPEAAVVLLGAVLVLVVRRSAAAGGLVVLAGVTVVGGLLELAPREALYEGPAVTVALGAAALLLAAVAGRRNARAVSPG